MALGRKQTRPDPLERAARRSHPELAALDLPPTGSNSKRLLLYFALGAVLVGLLRNGSGHAPGLATSCTKAAFALGAGEARTVSTVSWSATGPATAKVVLGIDTTTAPTTYRTGWLAGPAPLTACRAKGVFAVRVAPGPHVVTVFLLGAEGGVTTVGTTALTVTAR